MKVMVLFGSQHTDMPEEMRVETMELCVTACEKFATNNEVSVFFRPAGSCESPSPPCSLGETHGNQVGENVLCRWSKLNAVSKDKIRFLY